MVEIKKVATLNKVNPLLPHTLTLSHIEHTDHLLIVYIINVRYFHLVWWHHCCVVGNAYYPSLGVNILY